MKIFLSILVLASTALAQVDSTDLLQDEIADYLESVSIEQEDSELYDLIEQLFNNPINLNSADFDQLMVIPFMDVRTASSILVYREANSQFFSVNELNSIEGVNEAVIQRIKPFLTVRDIKTDDSKIITGESKKILSAELRSRAQSDIQDRSGFSGNKYGGSKLKSYNRIKIKFYEKLRAGVLIEKDPGEKSVNDFTSFHLYGENFYLDKFAFGDYLIEFGEGLAIWSPYAFSKGSETVGSVNRNSREIIPYTSTDENRFLRGAAGSYSIGDFMLTAFYSSNQIDANLDTISSTVVSIPVDGYHRTESEIRKKDRINEKIFGGIFSFSTMNKLKISLLHYSNSFNYPIAQNEIFDPVGSQFNFTSVSYKLLLEKFYFSGESAYNGISVANIFNAQFIALKNFSFITSVRSYPRNYWNFHSAGFGEKSGTQNEFGIYTGFRWRTKIGLLNFYLDQFKFPFASFTNPLPAAGYEILFEFSTRPISRSQFLMRYTHENKEVSVSTNASKIIDSQLRRKIRLDFSYDFTKQLRYRTRLEYMNFRLDRSPTIEDGYLAFTDIKYRSEILDVSARVIIFQTDSYNSRIYEFENDLRGIMRNTALFGSGIRWYFLARLEIIEDFYISAKFSETYKFGEKYLSSGNSLIEGNVENNLSIQIDYNY